MVTGQVGTSAEAKEVKCVQIQGMQGRKKNKQLLKNDKKL